MLLLAYDRLTQLEMLERVLNVLSEEGSSSIDISIFKKTSRFRTMKDQTMY